MIREVHYDLTAYLRYSQGEKIHQKVWNSIQIIPWTAAVGNCAGDRVAAAQPWASEAVRTEQSNNLRTASFLVQLKLSLMTFIALFGKLIIK